MTTLLSIPIVLLIVTVISVVSMAVLGSVTVTVFVTTFAWITIGTENLTGTCLNINKYEKVHVNS